jgi:transcriptional regulator with XRE-family HTH domain
MSSKRLSSVIKKKFSERLITALKLQTKKITTPSELALEFNLRFHGNPITPQVAQKWLSGGSTPTLDKILTLSSWLNVPISWFLSGSYIQDLEAVFNDVALDLTAKDTTLIMDIRKLSDHKRELIVNLVEIFLTEEVLSKNK